MRLVTTTVLAVLLAACAQAPASGPSHLPPAHSPALGAACPVFPADNPWNTDISSAPLDSHSAAWVASIGASAPFPPDFGSIYGIPYAVADGPTRPVPVTFLYAD